MGTDWTLWPTGDPLLDGMIAGLILAVVIIALAICWNNWRWRHWSRGGN